MVDVQQRPKLMRQMAFRQDSNDSQINVQHGRLAPPNSVPDSPRPQKESDQTANGQGVINMQVPDKKRDCGPPIRLDTIIVKEKR